MKADPLIVVTMDYLTLHGLHFKIQYGILINYLDYHSLDVHT